MYPREEVSLRLTILLRNRIAHDWFLTRLHTISEVFFFLVIQSGDAAKDTPFQDFLFVV